jgi:DNA processing protein
MDLLDLVAVSMLPVPRSRAASILKHLRISASTSGHSGRTLSDAVLTACGAPEADRDRAWDLAMSRARESLLGAERFGAQPVPWGDDRYPALLSCIPDPPPILWVRGNLDALGQPTVAIVGSRAATPYALDVAYRLGEELAAREIVVASGLARGVDSAAHRGSLAGEGVTIAALGSGVGRLYPSEHRQLSEKIVCKGALVSELWPDAPPLAEHFPLRNRIISGISLAVVVVEASEKSGSLITARYALDQGRDVMAVPGSVLSGRNGGSHGLLKDGAKVVECADDILDGLGWPIAGGQSESRAKYLKTDVLLDKMAPGEVYRLDELMELTGVTGTRLLPRLMELELAGLVTNTGTGFARRLVT